MFLFCSQTNSLAIQLTQSFFEVALVPKYGALVVLLHSQLSCFVLHGSLHCLQLVDSVVVSRHFLQPQVVQGLDLSFELEHLALPVRNFVAHSRAVSLQVIEHHHEILEGPIGGVKKFLSLEIVALKTFNLLLHAIDFRLGA